MPSLVSESKKKGEINYDYHMKDHNYDTVSLGQRSTQLPLGVFGGTTGGVTSAAEPSYNHNPALRES